MGPEVKESESLESTEATRQPVEMEGVSTDQVVERAGGASPQLDEERVQGPQQVQQSEEQKHN